MEVVLTYSERYETEKPILIDNRLFVQMTMLFPR